MIQDQKSVEQVSRCDEPYIHEGQVSAALESLVDDSTAARLAQAFQALSDPTRVRMISALRETELCVCDLAAVLGMTQSAVSHQLRTLRNQRLVKARKAGREVYYSLDDDHILELFELGLSHIQHR